MAGSVELAVPVGGSSPAAAPVQRNAAPENVPPDRGAPLSEEKREGVPDREEMETVATALGQVAEVMDRDLSFSVDDKTGDIVIKVMDGQGEVIRSIPSEDVLKLKESLNSMAGLLFSNEG
ncbi:MAG: flagellar protein FlaG [Candidatus Hydrogenedentota bacterium]|nr:MAG: flagellar protein FlaG [Candidatus Hydrogenedentota bacterium]